MFEQDFIVSVGWLNYLAGFFSCPALMLFVGVIGASIKFLRDHHTRRNTQPKKQQTSVSQSNGQKADCN